MKAILAMLCALSGCSAATPDVVQAPSGIRIDTQVVSANQDSRVRTLVLHYTAEPYEASLHSLTEPEYQVSSHYLVPDAATSGVFVVNQLVPETRRAWHAGISYWQRDEMLNSESIGIEIVNLGFSPADSDLPLMNRRWYSFPPAQIEAVAALAGDIVRRHEISPVRVVGHSDIAPGRKQDPGPLFPWQLLYAKYKLGAWPDADVVDWYKSNQPFDGNVASLQSRLAAYGYHMSGVTAGTLDPATVNAIESFQMHFRQQRYDGAPDVETVAILDALLHKYIAPDPRVNVPRAVQPQPELIELRKRKADAAGR